MSKKVQTLIVSISILGLAILFGCASVQDVIIPCWVSPAICDYADANSTSIMPYTTLFDAKRLDRKMDYIHEANQLKDNLEYGYLKGVNLFHMTSASEFQATIFSPQGPIGLLLPAIGSFSLGALFIKRPGDKSKKEIETEKKV